MAALRKFPNCKPPPKQPMETTSHGNKGACLLGKLSVDVAAAQETHFTCTEDCRVLEGNFVVFSALDSRCSAGVFLLVGCSLDSIVNLVFAGDGGQLVVADVAGKTLKFRVVAVYAPNSPGLGRTWTIRSGQF